MCKKRLQSERLARARLIAGRLVHLEARGWGDRANAIERLTERHGLPRSLLWSLLYRPSVRLTGAWGRLLAAYEAECERIEAWARSVREEARTWRDAADESDRGADRILDGPRPGPDGGPDAGGDAARRSTPPATAPLAVRQAAPDAAGAAGHHPGPRMRLIGAGRGGIGG